VSETASSLGKRALALVVLLVAAFVLFKIVLSVATFLVWIAIVCVAVIALVWAARTI
jgi:uncharacterized membrane protein YccC